MNYRHAFHAGNFADVFKHIVLTRILVHLGRKPAPFRYIDTHSGIGLYDLNGEEARRGGEWPDGVGRLDLSTADDGVRDLIRPYINVLGPRDAQGRPSLYPGSPVLAAALSRPQDKLVFCELHPDGAHRLRTAIGRDPRVKVVEIDGYMALKAFVPPPERRGLALIDPPFESRLEFGDMVDGLVAAHKKWPTGLYALWYPLKDRDAVAKFTAMLMVCGIRRMAQLELMVDRAAWEGGALGGCGLILVNPPFGLAEEMARIMPFLATSLGRPEPGSWQWRLLAGE